MNNPASSRANYSNTWAHNNTCCICSIEGDADLAGLEDRQGQVGFCFWPIGSKKAKKIRWHHSSSSHFLSLMLLKACTVICREHLHSTRRQQRARRLQAVCCSQYKSWHCVCVCEGHTKHHSFINQRVTFVPFILGTQTSSAAHRRVTCDLALQICELSFLRAIHLPVSSIVTIQHSLLFQVIIIIARLVGGGEGKNSSACFKAVPLEQNEEVVHWKSLEGQRKIINNGCKSRSSWRRQGIKEINGASHSK